LIEPLPLFVGRVKLPLYVAPACGMIASPGWVAFLSQVRRPPGPGAVLRHV